MAYTVRPAKEKLRILFRTKLRIVFEGIKAENISELCRREGISPSDYYRYREKIVEGALEALGRNGRKKRDPEKESLKKEQEKLKEIIFVLWLSRRKIIISQAGEIELLKKRPTGTGRICNWLSSTSRSETRVDRSY